MALAESKTLWPEEVVSKTWDVSVLESELVELCTLLALLAHKTVPQLRALYGATDWKTKYPAFKLGRNKRELLDNVKECYLSHTAEVLSLLKPKPKLVGLFDALKNRPELANRASTITRKNGDTHAILVQKVIALISSPETPTSTSSSSSSSSSAAGAAAGLEECKKEEEKQTKSGKRKRKEEGEEKQAIKEENQKKKRDNNCTNNKEKKDVKKQKPEKKATTNKNEEQEMAPKKKEEKKEGEGEEKEKEKEKEKEQEKRAEAPAASTNNINPAMSLPTETSNTIAPSTPSTAVLADIRSPAELPSNIQFRRQAPAALARESEQREGGLLVHQQRVSALIQQNKRIQQEAVSAQCANDIRSLMETLEAEFLEPWTARRVFIEPADLTLVLERYLQAARMYNNSK